MWIGLISLVLLGVLLGGLVWLDRSTEPETSGASLEIYCASGLRPVLEPVVRQYESEFGGTIQVHFGPSGGIEAQLKLADRGDLFIPAAWDPYLTRNQLTGRVREAVPLAELHLVLAVDPEYEAKIGSLADAVEQKVQLALANEQAAVGRLTRAILESQGKWDAVRRATKVFKPTVTDVAETIRQSGIVRAGVIWDATARQFGLDIVELPEFEAARCRTGIGVLDTAANPAAALHFARYLAAPEKGQPYFHKAHFLPFDADPWADVPELLLFSGTVNRAAIRETLAEFEHREGCHVRTVFEGCGTLVGMMKAGNFPDAYFACDISYVEQVHDHFDTPHQVSASPIVILVQPGNPHAIERLEDLARPGIVVGLCDPERTALGDLTIRLLKAAGVHDAIAANEPKTITTGDLLVTQLLASDKLDAVLVYAANCSKVGDRATVVRIDHPAARAIQPYSVHLESKFPSLARRLDAAISSKLSQQRFEAVGFEWLGETPTVPIPKLQ